MFLFLAVIIPLCISGQSPPSDADLRGIAQRMFLAMDTSRDGVIHLAEMVTGFQACDTDQDGRVSFHEFQWCSPRKDPSSEVMLRAIYKILDFNDDQHLEMADFTHIYQLWNTDDNDEVTENDFVAFWFERLRGVRAAGHIIG